MCCQRLLHHAVQHLLDLELPGSLQVGAPAARLGHNGSVAIRQQTDRLGPPRVDSQYVHVDSYGT